MFYFDGFDFDFSGFGGGADYGSSDAVLSLDPNAPPAEYEIDWSQIDFDNQPESPPSFLNGGAFDILSELYDLMANDPNINSVLDNASLEYAGNLEFESSVSMEDIYAALFESIDDGYYDDFFNFLDEDDFYNYSYQYNYDEELDGWIKEYV